MNTPDINFKNIRKHRNSQNDGFEELTRQLVLADPPQGYSSVENRGPGADGGVEILVRFPSGKVWGWQSKYFPDNFAQSEVGQLKKSFSAALANFGGLERYYVALPRDLSGHAEGDDNTQTKNWNTFKTWCATEAQKLGKIVEIHLWDETYFVSKLQRNEAIYAGMRQYWFDQKSFNPEWFRNQFNKSRAYIGKRYRPSDHIDMRISSYIHTLLQDETFKGRTRSIEESLKASLNALTELSTFGPEAISIQQHCSDLAELLRADIQTIEEYNRHDKPPTAFVGAVMRINTIGNGMSAFDGLEAALRNSSRTKDRKPSKLKETHLFSEKLREKIILFIQRLNAARRTFVELERRLLLKPMLLIEGEAGIGKSHLLAHEVDLHISAGGIGIFVPARVLDRGDRPEHDLLQYLDISNLQFETLLAAFQSAALASDSRALLAIDGLNESWDAAGWESGLPSLMTQVAKFDRIALCFSNRTSYRDLCIRKGTDIVTISHPGFRGDLGEAATEYLDRYGIERPSAPVFGLTDILHSPLFLSTAVDFLTSEGKTSFPRKLDSIRDVVQFWIGAVERSLVNRQFKRIELGDGKILEVLKRLAAEMASAGTEFVDFGTAHRICEEVVDLAPPSSQSERLLPRLIDEGLLLDAPAKTGTAKRVSFGFQLFGDYFIADAVIEDCGSTSALAEAIKSGGKYEHFFAKSTYRQFAGPRTALMALTAARYKTEFLLIQKGLPEEINIEVSEFVESLLWRHGEDFTAETVSLLERLRIGADEGTAQIDNAAWFDLLLKLAPLTDCPMNALYLKKQLASLPQGHRDATWSAYLMNADDEGEDDYDGAWTPIAQLIDWAWVGPGLGLEPAKVDQIALALGLMTSTTNRRVRDCSTKALASLLMKYPGRISALIDEFRDWDDSYVRERVLAAAMAGVVYTTDVPVLKAAAHSAHQMVFAKEPVERHAWTRRYAQLLIGHAIKNGAVADPSIVARSKPPYASSPISNWPTLADVATHEKEAASIFSSVIGWIPSPFNGEQPTMAGDFGRYIMGSIEDDFSAEVRGIQPPKSNSENLADFWNKVDALGENGKLIHAKITGIDEAQSRADSLSFAMIVDDFRRAHGRSPQSTETDGDVSLDKSLIDNVDLSDKKDALLSELPAEIQAEYRELTRWGRLDDRIPLFSLAKGQYWVFNRALELGWSPSLHDKTDRNYGGYNHGRREHGIERIGKKYQHIAFAELTGYLADHHWYVDRGANPRILMSLEEAERADIDPTYLAGSHSKPVRTFVPSGIRVPVLSFKPARQASANMKWTGSLRDIPAPAAYFLQSDDGGTEWALQSCFCRSKDYMRGFETTDPFRSAQYAIELLLIPSEDVAKLKDLTTEKIREKNHDLFDNGWPSAKFLGQRSFTDLREVPQIEPDYEAADVRFARATHRYIAKYSDFDQSGVDEETDFTTPHPALIKQLRLRPDSAWSSFFVDEEGKPAFSDSPGTLGGPTVIRRDLLDKFARENDYEPVWKVWVEKDGGLGSKRLSHHKHFARSDYIGFFYQQNGAWHGELIPFRE